VAWWLTASATRSWPPCCIFVVVVVVVVVRTATICRVYTLHPPDIFSILYKSPALSILFFIRIFMGDRL